MRDELVQQNLDAYLSAFLGVEIARNGIEIHADFKRHSVLPHVSSFDRGLITSPVNSTRRGACRDRNHTVEADKISIHRLSEQGVSPSNLMTLLTPEHDQLLG